MYDQARSNTLTEVKWNISLACLILRGGRATCKTGHALSFMEVAWRQVLRVDIAKVKSFSVNNH